MNYSFYLNRWQDKLLTLKRTDKTKYIKNKYTNDQEGKDKKYNICVIGNQKEKKESISVIWVHINRHYILIYK